MADALSLSPDYELRMTFPPYVIFRVKGCTGSYVEPLRFRPLRISTQNWKRVQFDWLRKSSLKVPLVVASKDSPGDFWKKLEPYDGRPGNIPKVPIPGSGNIRAKASLDQGKITIDTSKPGFPLWIKVSYHPDWHITGGKGELYPASPAFMLLVPKTSRVVLTFDVGSGIYLLGKIVFLLTILVLAIEGLFAGVAHFPRWVRAPRKTRSAAPLSLEDKSPNDLAGEHNPTMSTRRFPGENARFLLPFALMATIIATGLLTRNYRDPTLLYQLAVAKFDKIEGGAPLLIEPAKNFPALPKSPEPTQLLCLFDRCMAKFDHSEVFDNCESYKARLMGEHKMWNDLRPMLERYLADNPDTRMYAQALFWLGEASLETGRQDDAQRFFRKALFTWPPNSDVKLAGLSLAKIVGAGPLIKTAQELFSSGEYLRAYNIYAALTLSPDEKTRKACILPLAYCAFYLNRQEEASDLFVEWLADNFNGPQSEKVKADLKQCRAVIAYNKEWIKRAPGYSPARPGLLVRFFEWAERGFQP